MKKIELNSRYIHHRNKVTYRVVKLIPLKINRVWETAVLYEGPDGKTWARPEKNFLEKFELVEDPKESVVYISVGEDGHATVLTYSDDEGLLQRTTTLHDSGNRIVELLRSRCGHLSPFDIELENGTAYRLECVVCGEKYNF